MPQCEHNHDVDWVDRAGIWASVICLIHCALTPIALAFVPALIWGSGDYTHLVLAAVLPVIALLAFVPGYRQHRQKSVLVLAVLGLILIVLALGAPKPYVEVAMTMTGSLLLIGAHWYNRRLKSTHDKCQKTQAYG